MTKLIHKIIRMVDPAIDVENTLDRLSGEGWGLVSTFVVCDVAYAILRKRVATPYQFLDDL